MAVSEKNLGNYFIFMSLAELPFLLGIVWVWFDSGRLELMLLLGAAAVCVTSLFLMFAFIGARPKLIGISSLVSLLIGIVAWKMLGDPWLIGGGIFASVMLLQFIWPRAEKDHGGVNASR